jgi:hypothetical protein
VQNPRVSMYWRFFALADRTATRMISGDADAQLSLQDRAAGLESIQSCHKFHTMHVQHSAQFLVACGAPSMVFPTHKLCRLENRTCLQLCGTMTTTGLLKLCGLW